MTASMTNKTTPLLPDYDLQTQTEVLVRDSSIWVQSHWLNILIAAGIATAIVLALYAARSWAMRLCRRGGGVANWYSIFGRAVAKTTSFFIVMVAIRLVSNYAGAPGVVASTVQFLFTIAAVFQGAIWIREIIFGLVEHRTVGDDAAVGLSSALGIIRLLVSIVVFAIALVMVLSNLGVNVTGLVAGLGVGGIAIGLAAQGIFGDLLAALAIIFDKPFRLGDNIKFNNSEGVVEQIGLKSTRLRGPTGEQRIVSNRKLLDNEIQNTTHRIRNRFKYVFSLGYDTSPELVQKLPELLRAAVEGEGYKLVHGGLTGFGASGLDYDVEFESQGIDFPPEARDHVAAAILTRFRENGIAFAYPTQVNLIASGTHLEAPPKEE
ncbi:MAG: mechanosensitive ion channel [Sphingomonas sp.]|uniref:mechanosensitive ion channel family protein n=1 Tax=Sphingomonas sp. TaxID=28214 RepID=UPI002274F0D9|nr:mechanosensitive ion channel domain-containing protein [Sphingomonas sp.]MCX8475620.1 mechanosensitive ion channel [Sphingomonas sp.]